MNNTTSFKDNPLNKIIGLSIVLSMGFLLVVLAGINGNWFPILIGIIFAIAYTPIPISRALSSSSDYEFNFDPNSASSSGILKEAGLFISAFLATTGFYLPILLHHSHILTKTAMILTIIGGILIYGTVYTFSLYFDEPVEPDELGAVSGI